MAVHHYLDGSIRLDPGEEVAIRGEDDWPFQVTLRCEAIIEPLNRQPYRFEGERTGERPKHGDVLTDGTRRWHFLDGQGWRLRNEADTHFIDGHVMHSDVGAISNAPDIRPGGNDSDGDVRLLSDDAGTLTIGGAR